MPITDYFQVRTRIAAGGVVGGEDGIGLLLTTDGTLPAAGAGKRERFTSLDAIIKRFGAGAVATAATVWFATDPSPKPLYVGRWATALVQTKITGGTAPVLATLKAVSDGSFTWAGSNLSALDLSGAADLAAIAALIETAVRTVTGYGAASFDYTGGRFVLELVDAGEIADPEFGTAMAAGMTVGTDISGLLGFAAASNPVYAPGNALEAAITAAATIIDGLTDPPKFIFRDAATPDTLTVAATAHDTDLTLARWADAGDRVYGLRETAAATLITGNATDKLAIVNGENLENVIACYATGANRPDIAGCAMLSAIDFGGAATMITLHGKKVSGAGPETLTADQFTEIYRKRGNVIRSIGGSSVFTEGFAPKPGVWADSVAWLLWIKGALERAQWSALVGSRRLSRATLLEEIEKVCRQGVVNGGIRPGGTVNAEVKNDIRRVTGDPEFDGTLITGYRVWAGAIEDLTQEERDDRDGPPFQVWITGEPAIHRANTNLVFLN